jgi:hypothetical protein
MRRATEVLQTATNQLEEAGIAYVIEHGAKHIKIKWIIAGHSRWCTVSVSPSDVRCIRMMRSQVRRMLRQDGVLQ